jgi:hypothetical protein
MGPQAWEFLLMHWVEVRRWQDYKNFGSVNTDPIFKGNSVPNPEMGYPGCAAPGNALHTLQSALNAMSCHVLWQTGMHRLHTC